MMMAGSVIITILSFFILLVQAQPSPAQPTQWVIVDDFDPAISYWAQETPNPPSRWDSLTSSGVPSQTCLPQFPCFSKNIDANSAYNGTWHEARGVTTASFTFTGTSLQVYFIVRNTLRALTDVSFYIDNILVDRFYHLGSGVSGTEEWIDNQRVVLLTGWSPNDPHVLTMRQENPLSTMVFDYLRYSPPLGTTPSRTPTTPPPTTAASSNIAGTETKSVAPEQQTVLPSTDEPTGIPATTTKTPLSGGAIGGIVAAVVLIIAIAAITFLWIRSRQGSRRSKVVDLEGPDPIVYITRPYSTSTTLDSSEVSSFTPPSHHLHFHHQYSDSISSTRSLLSQPRPSLQRSDDAGSRDSRAESTSRSSSRDHGRKVFAKNLPQHLTLSNGMLEVDQSSSQFPLSPPPPYIFQAHP